MARMVRPDILAKILWRPQLKRLDWKIAISMLALALSILSLWVSFENRLHDEMHDEMVENEQLRLELRLLLLEEQLLMEDLGE